MIREKEPMSALVAIMIAIASLVTFMFVVVMNRLQLLQTQISASNVSPVDVSGWMTYHNSEYGFELSYPSEWELSTDGLQNDAPFVAFGNPLDGAKTYAMQVFIEKNPNALSSGAYEHALLAADQAQDAANAKNGAAPRVTPQFEKVYTFQVGGYPAYELYKVFEFDHFAERIYVAHGTEVLRFDFPSPQENPNLSLPVANNGIAHEILGTLVFTR
jgi:hypothetical protein